MPWKLRRPNPTEKENDQLRTDNVRLRRDLTNKTGYAAKLELLLRQRTQTVDELVGKLEQARAQNRRLSERKARTISGSTRHSGNIA